MKNYETIFFKIPVMCLLVGILGMLIAIYSKIPSSYPTFGDRYRINQGIKDKSARYEALRDLIMQRPLVYVDDVGTTVDVEGTVRVDNGYGPLEVEIMK